MALANKRLKRLFTCFQSTTPGERNAKRMEIHKNEILKAKPDKCSFKNNLFQLKHQTLQIHCVRRM